MNKQYFSLKGDFFLRERGTTAPFFYLGNVSESAVEMERETIVLKSSGNELGDLDEEELSLSANFSMTPNSLVARNLGIAFQGNVGEQAAAADQSFTVPAMKAGDAIRLPHVNVTNVVIDTLTEGVDYTVLASGGVIRARKDVAATTGTYDAGTAKTIGMFTNTKREFEVLYVSERSGKTFHFYRWKPSPASNFALISDEYAGIPVTGKLLADETAASGLMGRYAGIYDTSI